MKKTLLCLLCGALLCGCGGERAVDVQEQYRAVTTASMEAEVVSRVSTGDRVYTLTCDYDPDGQSVTTVTSPEELAGLTAVLAGGEMAVRSGDVLLPAGLSADVCPANCLPYLMASLAEGYRTEECRETWEDTDCLRLTLDTTGKDGDRVSCAIWLDGETLIPRYAEFTQREQVVLTVKMLSFTCTTEPEE